MPTQTSSGDGAIQIGKMDGGITQVNVTQHIYSPRSVPQTNSQPIRVSRPDRRGMPRAALKEDQHQVLMLMDYLPDRIAVLDFMQREFDTRMVVDLNPQQLYRLRRYVQVILEANKP